MAKELKIFTLPQEFPCGPQSSCCGPVGLSEEQINQLVNTIKKVFTDEIKVFNLFEKEVQKSNQEVVSIFNSLGWGALPVIALDKKIISVGLSSSEEELLDAIKSNL